MAFYNYGQPNYGGGYIPQPQQNMYQQPQQLQNMQQFNQPQQQGLPKTNKIFVTSLEEAMNRSVEPNSVVIYLHQDLPLLFEISTDFLGKKTYKTFDIIESVQKPQKTGQDGATVDLSGYVTRKEFDSVQAQLDGFKNILEKYDLKEKKSKEIIKE